MRTKNVIQIRSHAQKYFLKVQKNNTGEHIPPPRPKRKQGGVVPGASGVGVPYNIAMNNLSNPSLNNPVMRQPQVPVALSPSVAMQPQQMAFMAGGFNPMAAHVQLPPHLYSLHAMGMHAQTAQYMGFRHPMQALRPGPPNQRASGRAKAISPRMVDPNATAMNGVTGVAGVNAVANVAMMQQVQQQQQTQQRRQQFGLVPTAASNVELQHKLRQGSSANNNPGLQADARPRAQGLQPITPAINPQTAFSHFAQQQQHAARQLALASSENKRLATVPKNSATAAPLAPKKSEPQFDSLAVPNTAAAFAAFRSLSAEQELQLGHSVVPSSTTGSQPTNLTQTDTASTSPVTSVSPGVQTSSPGLPPSNPVPSSIGRPNATSPNFTRIYAFFATLFDPTKPLSVLNLIQRSDLSALDWEIIKLLVKNLEVNVDNVGFRQQLRETYQQQQVRLQEQTEQH